ncbi:ABC transporter permease subunit [Paenibacillus dendritiformis]|uniref:ABC transporter permease n=1 Tax=Paenibacillus dendritiformis TaxID=130049 RepID=UPI00143D4511|nr:ABC transporter permease [Paenibacillus dendritiformis]NKI22019.1 ABC transporter permease subunit [Paenibacillus dendritiformis]NRF96578.1 ABC transporter permease [Paenibacillus dendritiformis]
MSYFFSLVQNEWMKTNSKRQAPYYYIFLALMALLLGVVIRFFVFKDGAMPYLEFANTFVFIARPLTTIFIIIVAAQTITDEFKDGTIKQLLIRPASRSLVLASKWVNALLVLFAAYMIILLLGLGIGAALFNLAAEEATLMDSVMSLFLGYSEAAFQLTLAFMIAVLTRSLGLSIALPIIVQMLGGTVSMMLHQKEWYKWLVFPHLNWGPYFGEGQLPYEGATLGFSLMMYAIYFAVLLAVSFFVFQKRDVQ